MSVNPFVILGIPQSATQDEIRSAYETKKAYYQEHIFDDGEAGAEAAHNLQLVETAYQQAMEFVQAQASVSGQGNSAFEQVKEYLKNKEPDAAQKALDEITYRGAEWHYFQSIIFYEKNWLSDSKKQLEMCVELDPGNEKYTRALENVKKKIDGSRPFQGSEQSGTDEGTAQKRKATNRTYSQDQSVGQDAGDACCNACSTLICADCCCECCGFDLIPCC